MNLEQEIEDILKKLVNAFSPERVILFGSMVNHVPRNPRDIDLCIIKHTNNRKELLANMYMAIDSYVPVDLVLYSPEQWDVCKVDTTSLAYQIDTKGKVLYGSL